MKESFKNLPQFKKLSELDLHRISKLIDSSENLQKKRNNLQMQMNEINTEINDIYRAINSFWKRVIE